MRIYTSWSFPPRHSFLRFTVLRISHGIPILYKGLGAGSISILGIHVLGLPEWTCSCGRGQLLPFLREKFQQTVQVAGSLVCCETLDKNLGIMVSSFCMLSGIPDLITTFCWLGTDLPCRWNTQYVCPPGKRTPWCGGCQVRCWNRGILLLLTWMVLTMDASLPSWGGVLGTAKMQGTWTLLPLTFWGWCEVLPIVEGEDKMAKGLPVRMPSDSATVDAYVNQQGGTRSSTNDRY